MRNNKVLIGDYYFFTKVEDAIKKLDGDYSLATFDDKLRAVLSINPGLKEELEKHCIACETEIKRQGEQMGARLRWLEMKTRNLHECRRCGHTWLSKSPRPTVCPGCHSPYWDRERNASRNQ